MKEVQSETKILKLTTAYRQLNAAILMHLRCDDELAVHTVASAGYRVIFDLSRKRGGDPQVDHLKMSFFELAKKLENGGGDDFPPLLRHPKITEIVEAVLIEIRSGDVKSWRDISISSFESPWKFLERTNKIYNYLKHADKDAELPVDVTNLRKKNRDLMLNGVSLYATLDPINISREMRAFMIYTSVGIDGLVPWLEDKEQNSLRELTTEQLRLCCLSLLTERSKVSDHVLGLI